MQGCKLKLWIVVLFFLVAVPLSTQSALASNTPVGIGAFGAGSTLITFAGLADLTEVNGLIVTGTQFSYSLGNGQLVIDGGPGTTNNIAPPNITAIGNSSGILTILLPSSVNTFGYGYAVLSTVSVPNATTMSLFQGATPLGSLSYDGVIDPTFAGGFAGIQSTDPFNRVQLTFNSAAAPAFALDNIRTFNAVSAVPEPSMLPFIGAGITSLLFYRRKRSKRQLRGRNP
jgi:hypothetical protein